MSNINHLKSFAQKMSMTKIKLFSVTSVNFGFILNVATNYLDYMYLQNSDESWYCKECCSTIFPFK